MSMRLHEQIQNRVCKRVIKWRAYHLAHLQLHGYTNFSLKREYSFSDSPVKATSLTAWLKKKKSFCYLKTEENQSTVFEKFFCYLSVDGFVIEILARPIVTAKNEQETPVWTIPTSTKKLVCNTILFPGVRILLWATYFNLKNWCFTVSLPLVWTTTVLCCEKAVSYSIVPFFFCYFLWHHLYFWWATWIPKSPHAAAVTICAFALKKKCNYSIIFFHTCNS